MKQPKQFRFSSGTIAALERQAKKYGMTQTAYIESILADIEAKEKKRKTSDDFWLSDLCTKPVISEQQATAMLASIYENRINKPL